MKRFTALLIAAMLLLSLASVASAELAAVGGELPLWVGETQKMTVGMVKNDNVEDFETNVYTGLLEKAGNVDLDFVIFPNVETNTKFAAMLMANEEFPDVIAFDLGDYRNNFIEAGVLLPIDEYLETSSVYVKAYMDDPANADMLPYFKAYDGNIYAIPYLNKVIGNEWASRAWINQDWLTKLDMPIPTTTDEYLETLRAFRANDLNGDGATDDQYPLLTFVGGWNSEPYNFLMSSFIFANAAVDYLLVDENGVLDIAINKPEWKAGLQYMNQLVNENLLDKISFTQDQNAMRSIIKQDNKPLGSTIVSSTSLWQEHPNREDMVAMGPLVGPEGVQYTTPFIQLPSGRWYITRYADNPELAFRLGDYTWNPTVSVASRLGEPETDWHWTSEEEKATLKALYWDMGFEAMLVRINDRWGVLQNGHWTDNTSAYRPYEYADPGFVWSGDIHDYLYTTALAVKLNYQKVPDNFVLPLVLTGDEAVEAADLKVAINALRDEWRTGLVLGTQSFDDWDAYVNELDIAGLPRWLEIQQSAYDRMFK